MRRAVAILAFCLIGLGILDARQPPAAARAELPIRRVVLYKSGIGFFEHVGPVTGDARVTIPLTSPQLDDVIKTLTVLDLDGGRVSSISYSSEAPIERRLDALGLPLGEHATLLEFLSALRGAEVEVSRGAIAVKGRLLDTESKGRPRDGGVEQVDQIAVVTARGDVHAIELGASTVVRFADADLNERVNRYLELVGSSHDQQGRSFTIATSGQGTRRLYVGYVSEVPVWKTTYRLVMPSASDARPLLQGWAIVDNTVGEDWANVELSLVAGAPQSFVQPVSQPLYTRRPHVPIAAGLLLTPQTHGGAIATANAAGVVVDPAESVLPGVTVRLFDRVGQVIGTAVTGADGRFSIGNAAGQVRAEFTLQGFRPVTRHFDAGAEQRVVMGVDGLTETVTVTSGTAASGRVDKRRDPNLGGGVVGGVMGGRPAPPPAPPAPFRIGGSLPHGASVPPQATGDDLGELFEYKLAQPVTIRQNQSAMVPIVAAPISAERVSLWKASDRSSRPRRAVRITNTSGLTLDGGSVAVIDAETFAGEGLVETIKPKERRLISYAADLGMLVEGVPETLSAPKTRILISRGVLTTESFQCQRLRYTARNQDAAPRTLIIEQARSQGWQLAESSPKPAETTTDAYRFQLSVPSDGTGSLVVSSYRPMKSATRLADAGEGDLDLLLTQVEWDQASRAAFEPLAVARRELADLERRYQANNTEMAAIETGQTRIRENMRALKGSSEEKQLLERYVRQLTGQEDRLAALRESRVTLEREIEEKRRAFVRLAESLTAEAGPLGTPCS